MSTTLQIRTSWHSPGPMEDLSYLDTFEPPKILRPRKIFIEVRLELLDHLGRCGHAYVWKMEARDNYDEAELRRAFLQSTYWEREVWSEATPDPKNITQVVVYDTPGILKWLAPGQDLKDFFTTQTTKQINAQPLRIAPPCS